MTMGGVDKKGSVELQLQKEKDIRREKRLKKQQEREEKEKQRVCADLMEQTQANSTFFSEEEDAPRGKRKRKDSDKDYDTETIEMPQKKYNKTSLVSTALACDGTGVSSRKATIICNQYAKDIGYLTWENRETHTLGKSKLDKWRKKERQKRIAEEEEKISQRPVRAIFFDGKKTASLVRVQGKSGMYFQKSEIQDHYVMIEEPDSVYLGHVIPYSGHGMSIAVALYRFLKSRGWEKDIVVVGCDGTNANVGNMKGCIPYLEKLLGHPVEWNVCLLHANELPFRAEFAHYDGKTSGPSSFQGPLGKELQGDVTMREPVRFVRIKNDSFPRLTDEVVADLSHNQEYLYDMSLSLIEGSIEDDLECREPGAVCHSRWVTLANRIFLLYHP